MMSPESDIDLDDIKDEQLPNKRTINVIIIGESGTGKSALINQTYDANVVESSDQAVGCTIQSTRVSGEIKGHPDLELNLYDTAGLSESGYGSVSTVDVYIQLIKLCYAIPGGIHLLIFCHQKGRISGTQFQMNYRIFYEELCEKNTPVLLVITHCDKDKPLNQWWDANKDLIHNQLKFTFADGVCVSTIKNSTNNPDYISEVYTSSRENLIQAIRKCASYEPVRLDSWKRKLIMRMRQVYNQVFSLIRWRGFEEKSLRPELEQMFIDLKYSREEAKDATKRLLKEVDAPNSIGSVKITEVICH